MISSDKNVETFAQLAEETKHYFDLQKEYVKLDVIEKVVQLVTVMARALVAMALVTFVIVCLSIALAFFLEPWLGRVAAFCLVAGIHFLILIIFIAKRRSWIEKPLVKFLADLLLNN